MGMNLWRMPEQDVDDKRAEAVPRDGEGDVVMDPPPPLPLVDDETQLSGIAPGVSIPAVVSDSASIPTTGSNPGTAAETWGIADMSEALRLEIVEMSEEARAAFTSRLRRMSDFELKREVHNAHNRRVARNLGLEGVTAFFGMKKRGRSRTGSGKAKKRRKADDGVEEDSLSSDDDSEGDDDSGDESVGDSRRTPVKTRGSARASKSAAVAKSPKWADSAKAVLLDGQGLGMGPVWKNVVDLWWALEETWNFASSVSVSFEGS
jgi:hypothetical protein